MPRETTYSGNQVMGQVPDPVDVDTTPSLGLGDVGVTVNEDGSIDIDINGKAGGEGDDSEFDSNLADKVNSTLATDIISAVRADLTSRADFIANYNKGLELLGLKIEESTTTRTQKRNVSRVGHPLLLEAVVKFQAQARAELLPAIGPCKAALVGGSTEVEDQKADDFEADVNFFLTQTDKGYYPDFDRGLFALGFGGNLFKKVYRDPVRRYPVSRSIQIEDFIVSEDASSIDDAQRKTHRIYMSHGELKRMQLAGAYVDVDLGQGQSPNDPTKQKLGAIIGVQSSSARPEDQEHEIFETYTDLDLAAHGYDDPYCDLKGLPVPYIVSVSTTSQTILSIRRNWKEDDEQYAERKRFVHYGLIPSFGFLCLGYLHLLGNQTRTLRAIWRIQIDAGMFSVFPGGMKAKSVRTDTNEIAPGPGEFVDVDIGPFDDIKSAFMVMPYKDVSPNLMQLSELIGQDSMRLASIPEMEVGEGRTHIPVGTMMSMVEQATQTMASVHKRLHSAMSEELALIREFFVEDPEALTKMARNPKRKWETADEFADIDIYPASDPNIPSQAHRTMQAAAIIALQQGAQPLYDAVAVQKKALRAIGISDPQTLLNQSPSPPPPDPKAMLGIGQLQLKKQELGQKAQDNQRKAAHEALQAQQSAKKQHHEMQMDLFDQMTKQQIAHEKEQTSRMRFAHEATTEAFARGHEANLQQHEHENKLAITKAKPKPASPKAKK